MLEDLTIIGKEWLDAVHYIRRISDPSDKSIFEETPMIKTHAVISSSPYFGRVRIQSYLVYSGNNQEIPKIKSGKYIRKNEIDSKTGMPSKAYSNWGDMMIRWEIGNFSSWHDMELPIGEALRTHTNQFPYKDAIMTLSHSGMLKSTESKPGFRLAVSPNAETGKLPKGLEL